MNDTITSKSNDNEINVNSNLITFKNYPKFNGLKHCYDIPLKEVIQSNKKLTDYSIFDSNETRLLDITNVLLNYRNSR